jgi:hypothetical protein
MSLLGEILHPGSECVSKHFRVSGFHPFTAPCGCNSVGQQRAKPQTKGAAGLENRKCERWWDLPQTRPSHLSGSDSFSNQKFGRTTAYMIRPSWLTPVKSRRNHVP